MKITDTINFDVARNAMLAVAEKAIAATASELQSESIAQSPEDTGDLKRSTVAVQRDRLAWSVIVGVHYAKYVHFGFIHYISQKFIPPNPFLSRAMVNIAGRFRMIIVNSDIKISS